MGNKISMEFKYKEWYAIKHTLEVQIEKRKIESKVSEELTEKEIFTKDIREEKRILRDINKIIRRHSW